MFRMKHYRINGIAIISYFNVINIVLIRYIHTFHYHKFINQRQILLERDIFFKVITSIWYDKAFPWKFGIFIVTLCLVSCSNRWHIYGFVQGEKYNVVLKNTPPPESIFLGASHTRNKNCGGKLSPSSPDNDTTGRSF